MSTPIQIAFSAVEAYSAVKAYSSYFSEFRSLEETRDGSENISEIDPSVVDVPTPGGSDYENEFPSVVKMNKKQLSEMCETILSAIQYVFWGSKSEIGYNKEHEIEYNNLVTLCDKSLMANLILTESEENLRNNVIHSMVTFETRKHEYNKLMLTQRIILLALPIFSVIASFFFRYIFSLGSLGILCLVVKMYMDYNEFGREMNKLSQILKEAKTTYQELI